MTKEKWIEHMKETGNHDRESCPICKERKKTYQANKRARITRSVYNSLGMKRVHGSLGGVYYE